MNKQADVSIIGGGLAGLTAAIHLAKLGYSVTVFERQTYPNHKVCGEYVSREVLPYLEFLALDLPLPELPHIKRLQLTLPTGKQSFHQLPLGGFGISRFLFDELSYKHAVTLGVQFIFKKVEEVRFTHSQFKITTASKDSFTATLCLAAWGKRSNLDKQFDRKFITQQSEWMAVKGHYRYECDDDLISLHNFKGGYCGVSQIEDGIVNACYLLDTKIFKNYGNITTVEKNVLMQNPFLAKFKREAKPLFQQPLTISQISFQQKDSVINHMLLIGDSAGLIHPLCGNGMAMAIHAAKIAAENCHDFFNAHQNRETLETSYNSLWKAAFTKRLNIGRSVQRVLLNQQLSTPLLSVAQMLPGAVSKIISMTHGKPFGVRL